MHFQKLKMHLQKLKMHFQNLGNPFPKIENPFAKFLEMHFQKFKIHLQKFKIISEIHGNAFAKSMIFFTVKHFLNAFPKPQNQNAFFFSRASFFVEKQIFWILGIFVFLT
jgi:hypothetical protein